MTNIPLGLFPVVQIVLQIDAGLGVVTDIARPRAHAPPPERSLNLGSGFGFTFLGTLLEVCSLFARLWIFISAQLFHPRVFKQFFPGNKKGVVVILNRIRTVSKHSAPFMQPSPTCLDQRPSPSFSALPNLICS